MSDRAIIEGHTIRRSILIDAPRASVWAALTEPAQISQWFGDSTHFDTIEVGAVGTFTWEGYGTFPVVITALDPMHVFAYRWANEPGGTLGDDSSTLVTFTLEDVDEATGLTVVETGFEALAGGTILRRRRLEENRDGWTSELDELRALFS
ncbi:hypothetical protein BH11ACT4_BH11ACT4_05820 [soil metagenome]